jgi:hypothetical protein
MADELRVRLLGPREERCPTCHKPVARYLTNDQLRALVQRDLPGGGAGARQLERVTGLSERTLRRVAESGDGGGRVWFALDRHYQGQAPPQSRMRVDLPR